MFRLIALIGIAATVAAVLGHFVLFGPKRLSDPKQPRQIQRFRFWERFIHIATVAGFLGLAVTGFYSVLALGSPLQGWWWLIHASAAPVFAIALTLMVATWAKDGVFVSFDWEWALKFGGYLGFGKHPPAGRFNAGQKAYFWMAALLGTIVLLTGLGRMFPVFDAEGQDIVYQTHRYAALLFVLAGITHLYLGTIANPGTLGAMMFGKVSRVWAEEHHPQWWETIAPESKSKK